MINIRKFAPLDQPAATKLQEEFMLEFFPEYASDPRQYQWNADAYDIDEHYLESGGMFWVAEENNSIIGFGGFRFVDENTVEIKRLRISAQHRGIGIGKSIVRKIEIYCLENRIFNVLVDTSDRLDVARKMYLNMGYKYIRTDTETDAGVEYSDHFFKKTLIKK